MKTTRLWLGETEQLLADPSLNLKLVFLVRDPRGTFNSRSVQSPWCYGMVECYDPTTSCARTLADVKVGHFY